MPKSLLSSLTIFFPFFNDAGTVQEAISLAYQVGSKLTSDLEVIAMHGGRSHDKTLNEIKQAKKTWNQLKIIDKRDNTEGYAVIKYGFLAATKDWIFYTDGDLQYNIQELSKLVITQLKTGADVVNGYKKKRTDSLVRRVSGFLYQQLSHFIFQLPIRDIDCDFRLLRSSFVKKITLHQRNASILPELILSLQKNGATFAEAPVAHYQRKYGVSNYHWWQLGWEKIRGDGKLFLELQKRKNGIYHPRSE